MKKQENGKYNFNVNNEKRLKSEFNLKKYSNFEDIFDKILDLDQPLYFSPIAIKNALIRMQEDDGYGNEDLFELAKNICEKWTKFHAIFREFLFTEIDSENWMNFKTFKNRLIIKYSMDDEFKVEIAKYMKYLEKNETFFEINGNNLGSSFKVPAGKGSNYLKAVFYEIYNKVWSYYNQTINKNIDDKLLNKLKENLKFETNYYFVSTRGMSDNISDIFFTINEPLFKKYSEKIYDSNNIPKEDRLISKWFNIDNDDEVENFDYNYIYPYMFLRSSNYLKSFADRKPPIKIRETSKSQEKLEIINELDFNNFIDTFDIVKSDEDERRRVEIADKKELKKVNSILKIMKSDSLYGIDDLKVEAINILMNSSPLNEVLLFKENKECILESEDKISNEIFKNIYSVESIFETEFNTKVYGSDSREDIIMTMRKKSDRILEERFLELEDKISRIESAISQNDASIISLIESDRSYGSVQKAIENKRSIDRNEFLGKEDAKIIVEAKKMNANEIINLLENNVSLTLGQRESYLARRRKKTKFVESIGLNYISRRDVKLAIESLDKKINEIENANLEEEVKNSKIQSKIEIKNLLNSIYSNGKYLHGSTDDVIFVFDCKKPSEY